MVWKIGMAMVIVLVVMTKVNIHLDITDNGGDYNYDNRDKNNSICISDGYYDDDNNSNNDDIDKDEEDEEKQDEDEDGDDVLIILSNGAIHFLNHHLYLGITQNQAGKENVYI